MGDLRFNSFYVRVRDAADPATVMRALSDEEVVFALAGASARGDAYTANVLATEAANRVRRTSATMASLGEGVYAIDAHGAVTFVNPAAEHMLGWRREEVLNRPVTETLHHGTDARRNGHPTVADVLAKMEPPRHADVMFTRRDGSTFHASCTLSPLVRDGEAEGVVVAFRDVTEREEAETTLREQAHTLDKLVEVNQALAAELDLDRLVQAVTDAGTEITGAAFGAFFYNVVDDKGAAYMLYALTGAPRDAFSDFPHPRATEVFGPTFRGEGVIRLDDVTQDPRYGNNPPYNGMPEGHLPVRSYLAAPVVSRSGEVIGGLFFGHPEPGVFDEQAEHLVVGIASQAAIAVDNARAYQAARTELEERKRAEKALAESEEKYRRLVEASPDAVVVHRDGVLVYANTACAALFGVTGPEDMIGRRILDFVHEESRDAVAERLQRMYETGTSSEPTRQRVVRVDGSSAIVDVRAAPVPYEGRAAIQSILRAVE